MQFPFILSAPLEDKRQEAEDRRHSNITIATKLQVPNDNSSGTAASSDTETQNNSTVQLQQQQQPEEEEKEVLPRPHPHAGAKDEFGHWGYIHDPTYVKNHPLPFIHDLNDGNPPICETPFGLGEELAAGYQGLKLVTVANDTIHNNHTTSFWPKILCIIYTHSNHHDTLVQSVVETYAPHCDGFMAASNQTNRTIGAVHLPHEGPESYREMWNKVRSIWSYVHDNYSNDFDYFHLGGDDMYVIPQNLRQYVATLSNLTSSPFQHLGSIIGGSSWKTHCGGGAGYTLNRATLKVLVEWLLPRCRVGVSTSQEDVMVSNCFLRYNKQCHCNDTRDARMATRYHQNSAAWQMEWDGGFHNVMSTKKLLERYNFIYLPGAQGLSPNSISFHLKHPSLLHMQRSIKRYHAILFPSICQSWTAT